MILVVLENQRGSIHAFSKEAVVAGQSLGSKLGMDVSILCMGENASSLKEQANDYKSQNLILAEHDMVSTYSADGYSKVLSDVITELSPKYVIMGHSYMVRDFLPRVSAKLDIPFVSDSISVTYDGDNPVFARQVFNAKLATNIQPDSNSNTTLLSFQSAAFSSDDIELGGSDAASVFEVNLNTEDIKSTELKESDMIISENSPVRVIRAPYFGKVGTVVSLPAPLVQMESEAMVRVAEVKFEDGDVVTIPRANLEMILH
jgi:electron transfer flavoprotein alpha subunit